MSLLVTVSLVAPGAVDGEYSVPKNAMSASEPQCPSRFRQAELELADDVRIKATPALFGPCFTRLRGIMVVAEDDGCSELESGRGIAVMPRGGCPFETKLANAQQAGYRAAIVLDPEEGDLTFMESTKKVDEHGIPGLLVQGRGARLVGEALNRDRTFVRVRVETGDKAGYRTPIRLPEQPKAIYLRPEYPYSASLSAWEWAYWITACVACFLSVLSLIFLARVMFVAYCTGSSFEDELESQAQVLLTPKKPLADPAHLPILAWREKMESCPICLESFATGDMLRTLPCGHGFHPTCIDPWLRERWACCPCCKAEVPSGTRTAAGAFWSRWKYSFVGLLRGTNAR